MSVTGLPMGDMDIAMGLGATATAGVGKTMLTTSGDVVIDMGLWTMSDAGVGTAMLKTSGVII